ncbi:MAG: phosphotransferase [Chloroflexota bacterium]
MICDPLKICASEGIKVHSYKILVERPEHLVAKVETANRPVVLKASTVPNHNAWDERNLKLFADAGLPVQKMLGRGEEPLSYIILSWIEGKPLRDTSPLEAQIAAGRLLHTIHHLEKRPLYDKDYGYDDWMKGWLNVALPWWGKQEGVSASWIDNAWAGFDAIRPLLATRGHHHMLQDGRPEHFIVRDGKLVGLIDVHDGQPGDGAMDLGVIGVFDGPLLQNMLKGYEVDAVEQEKVDQMIPFYVFLRRLAAAEWHSNHGDLAIARRALELANANPYGRH